MTQAGEKATFIATLGTAPQIVTITLDLLLKRGIHVCETIVVHTDHPETLHAISVLQNEFESRDYSHIQLRPILLRIGDAPLKDLDSESGFNSLIRALFREIRQAHLDNRAVHIGIAGGRKVMAIAAMVVAQLLFTEHDAVWHLFSDVYDRDDQRLHAMPAMNSRIVRVPVLRYGNASQMLAAFTHLGDPLAAIKLQEQLIEGETMRRRREFVERWLTAAERKVVRLACEGLINAAIARNLNKSERTVQNQLSAVYEKLHEWRGFPLDSTSDRNMLIAIFSPYFVLRGMAE